MQQTASCIKHVIRSGALNYCTTSATKLRDYAQADFRVSKIVLKNVSEKLGSATEIFKNH
jgi:L-asparaginase II